MDVAGKRVYVGLSGGVDSAVAAALLQEQGAKVTGVFIKGWYPPGMPCTWAADRQDAMHVAARLRIPFRTLDAAAAYKRAVIDYLLAEYRALRTPNPDIMCNREIKFGSFYHYARAAGADHIATGHYAGQLEEQGLAAPRDHERDQRYFLALVPREALAHTLFPLAGREKRLVRTLAQRYGLSVAGKKDSQGVCFLGSISVKEFLAAELGAADALLHTIGERVEGKYVVGKRDGELVLADTPSLQELRAVPFASANWLAEPGQRVYAQMRYRAMRVAGRIEGSSFLPEEPLWELPAPGQLIAFYTSATSRDASDALLGGGILGAYAA